MKAEYTLGEMFTISHNLLLKIQKEMEIDSNTRLSCGTEKEIESQIERTREWILCHV